MTGTFNPGKGVHMSNTVPEGYTALKLEQDTHSYLEGRQDLSGAVRSFLRYRCTGVAF